MNGQRANDLWHLTIDDLLTGPQEPERLGGPGPFVINLSASTAPITAPAAVLKRFEHLRAYTLKRNEDGRPRFRLRLGPIASELEADAILAAVREDYPSAFTAVAAEDDLRACTREGKGRSQPSPAAAPAAKPTNGSVPASVSGPDLADLLAPDDVVDSPGELETEIDLASLPKAQSRPTAKGQVRHAAPAPVHKAPAASKTPSVTNPTPSAHATHAKPSPTAKSSPHAKVPPPSKAASPPAAHEETGGFNIDFDAFLPPMPVNHNYAPPAPAKPVAPALPAAPVHVRSDRGRRRGKLKARPAKAHAVSPGPASTALRKAEPPKVEAHKPAAPKVETPRVEPPEPRKSEPPVEVVEPPFDPNAVTDQVPVLTMPVDEIPELSLDEVVPAPAPAKALASTATPATRTATPGSKTARTARTASQAATPPVTDARSVAASQLVAILTAPAAALPAKADSGDADLAGIVARSNAMVESLEARDRPPDAAPLDEVPVLHEVVKTAPPAGTRSAAAAEPPPVTIAQDLAFEAAVEIDDVADIVAFSAPVPVSSVVSADSALAAIEMDLMAVDAVDALVGAPSVGAASVTPVHVEPPVVDAPAMEAAVVEPAAIEPAAIEAAVIEAGAIEPAAIEAAVIEAGAIEPAAIEAAVIEAAVIEAPVIESAVVEAVIVEPIAAEPEPEPAPAAQAEPTTASACATAAATETATETVAATEERFSVDSAILEALSVGALSSEAAVEPAAVPAVTVDVGAVTFVPVTTAPALLAPAMRESHQPELAQPESPRPELSQPESQPESQLPESPVRAAIREPLQARIEEVEVIEAIDLSGQHERPPVEVLSDDSPALDCTQTIRELTPLELADGESSRYFVIQVSLTEEPVAAESIPRLDIFSEYQLYDVAGMVQGEFRHALRVGFFSDEAAALAVAGYLKFFFDMSEVKRVSHAERDRFAKRRVEGKREVGDSGKHQVIELSTTPKARETTLAELAPQQRPAQSGSLWSRIVSPLRR